MRTPCAVLALAAAVAAQASVADYARTWPLALDGDDGAYRIELGEDVYRNVRRPDLRDLVVLDADGAEVAFGPVPQPPGARGAPMRATRALPLFRLPRDAEAPIEESIEMHLVRGPDGRLAPIVRSASVPLATPSEAILLDASAAAGTIDAIEVELDAAASGHLDASVDVLASDDLSRWWPVAEAIALVSLAHEGHVLERRRFELPAVGSRYLLLQRVDSHEPLPVTAAIAHVTQSAPGVSPATRRALALSAPAASDANGVFEFDSGGPFPFERAQVVLAQDNSVVDVRVESRAAADAPWTPRAAATAFRVRTAGTELANDGDELAATRDRYWRVVTSPPIATPPRLVLEYRPDSFVMLAQGRAPYRLAAGSFTHARAAYPLEALLAALRARLGEAWTPSRAVPGEGVAISTPGRDPPRAPLPWFRWGLWLVLAGGAAGIVIMVSRLLRERRSRD